MTLHEKLQAERAEGIEQEKKTVCIAIFPAWADSRADCKRL